MLTQSRFFWVNLIFFLIIGGVLIFLAYLKNGAVFHETKVLPDHGSVADFELVDQNGRKASAADLKGEVWLADFIFTRCAGQCPLMSARMQELSRELKDVRFVSFTVDPGYDTPEILAEYAGRYEADARQWLFLTGDKETLDHLTAGFHMNKIDEPAFHSASFVLIDREGRIRGYYDANDEKRVQELKQDARILVIKNLSQLK